MEEIPLKIKAYCYKCESELKVEITRLEVLGGIGVAIDVHPCECCANDSRKERDLAD